MKTYALFALSALSVATSTSSDVFAQPQNLQNVQQSSTIAQPGAAARPISPAPQQPSAAAQLQSAQFSNFRSDKLSEIMQRPDSEIIRDAQGNTARMGDIKAAINAKRALAESKTEPSHDALRKTTMRVSKPSSDLQKHRELTSAISRTVNGELSNLRAAPPVNLSMPRAAGALGTQAAQGVAGNAAATAFKGERLSERSAASALDPCASANATSSATSISVAGSSGGRFNVTPRQGVLVKGCFNDDREVVEIRVNGQFPSGRVIVPISSKTDAFAFGNFPELSGVPDQPVTLSVKYKNGSSSQERQGNFIADREVIQLDPANIPGFKVRANPGTGQSTPGGNLELAHGTGFDNQQAGTDIYVPALAKNFEITNFWGNWSGESADFKWSSEGFPQIDWRARRTIQKTSLTINCLAVSPFACIATNGKPIVIDIKTTEVDSAKVVIDGVEISGPKGMNWRQ